MPAGRPWSPDEIILLRRRFDEGVPYSAIAKELGRSVSSITNRAAWLGLWREDFRTAALTGDELSYIREHHGKDTVYRIAKDLGKPWSTVRGAMLRMGLRIESDDNGWSVAELERMRRMAEDGRTVSEIASALGRTDNAIYIKARKAGIVIYQPGRKWSVEELDYLRRSWGNTGISTIAKHVHRDVDAVLQQGHKMRLGPLYGLSEDLPLQEFVRNVGISRDRILGTLVPKYGFPLKSSRYGKRQYYYFVDFEKILPWMERHQILFDGSKIKHGFFAIEPDWLVAKIRQDTEDNGYLPYDVRKEWWTVREISDAKTLMKLGWSYRQIGEKLGRSKQAVAYKMRSEGASYTLKQFWTGREFKYLKDHWRLESDEEIAAALGRTRGGVEAQRISLGYFRSRDLDRDEMAYVAANWQSMSDEELADVFNKSRAAVANARYRMGLFRPELKEWSPNAKSRFSGVSWKMWHRGRLFPSNTAKHLSARSSSGT